VQRRGRGAEERGEAGAEKASACEVRMPPTMGTGGQSRQFSNRLRKYAAHRIWGALVEGRGERVRVDASEVRHPSRATSSHGRSPHGWRAAVRGTPGLAAPAARLLVGLSNDWLPGALAHVRSASLCCARPRRKKLTRSHWLTMAACSAQAQVHGHSGWPRCASFVPARCAWRSNGDRCGHLCGHLCRHVCALERYSSYNGYGTKPLVPRRSRGCCLNPAVSVLLLFASLPDCVQNQTAVSSYTLNLLRLLSVF
jgi:hypothetical protein